MGEQSNILDTVKAKLIQANTDTTSDEGRMSIGKDIKKLLEQLNNIARQTNYNGRNLISDSAGTAGSTSHVFQVGEKATNTIKMAAVTSNTTGLALTTLSGAIGGSGTITKANASLAQTAVDNAINKLNGFRGDIGSTQNQVESAVRNLMTQATNVKAAESIIRDVDYAAESANFNKQNIVAQAGSYAISQANAVQQNVLRLLQ
jgi:flagellin